MRVLTLTLTFIIALCAQAQAACYADYKASRENPLELQYGVAQIFGECSVPSAWAELGPRLAADGWQLLEVLATFDESGLAARQGSAGQYFLRY
jgi:hypothetical protein